jgi:uncharacterized protein YjbJ (UPF0337 family)
VGQTTHDDLDRIAGKRDQLEEKLQESHSNARDNICGGGNATGFSLGLRRQLSSYDRVGR